MKCSEWGRWAVQWGTSAFAGYSVSFLTWTSAAKFPVLNLLFCLFKLVTTGDLRQLLHVSLSAVFENCSHPLTVCLGIWSILMGFQMIFAFVWLFQIPQERSDCNKIGSQQGYWLGDRQPVQTTCPFIFLNFVPWGVLLTWNPGYLVHVVSQSLCQCFVTQFLEPRGFSAVRF